MNEILTWACLNGAKFLAKEAEMGTLTPGKRPGIVLVENVDADGCFTSESRSRRII
jgi:imidazolonepropionase-like amidohydrolase